ncbi:MAG: penicillin acylase family protein [Bacteroidales bacterium]|nr:penicillin acylase family protein [Bacteroidales bacterium]
MAIIKRIFIYILLVIIGLIIGTFIYMQGQKPDYDGKLSLKGLNDKVDVYFDKWGIPHIYALNRHDAYMALGYVHAQERLFQMEMMRRVASGKLAEILGKDLVETDKFFRSLMLKKTAKESIETHFNDHPQIAEAAKAYIEGINEYIDEGSFPVEFVMIGIPKEHFSVEDMYMIAGYMAYTFQAAFNIDPLMSKIKQKLGDKYLKGFALNYIPGTERIPVFQNIDSSLAFADKINKILTDLPVPLLVGSNSWVLSPQKSKSGKVLFANDTHIAYAQPAVWYEAQITYPGYSIYGNYLAGVPFALLGHNRNIAWGLTMFENDDLDMFREKLNPDNPNQVRFKDHWEDLQIIKETIKVKDAEDIDFTIKVSRHGPIMTDVLANAKGIKDPIAVWWTFNQTKTQILEAFYKINHAKNVYDVAQAASLIATPGLNVMCGDKEGNIGWWAAAKLIKRPAHVQANLILDGSSGKDEFLGFYDFKDNPQAINPPQAYVYSANNQPDTTVDILYPGYYAPEDRANRIVSKLNQDKKWDIESLKEMQTDVISKLHAEEAHKILALIDKSKLDNLSVQAYELLEKWDGNHQTKDIAPVIFYKLLYKILKNTFEDELGVNDFEKIVSTHMMQRTYPALFSNDSSLWWDNINTEKIEKRRDIFNLSFTQSIEELKKQLGENINEWKWEKVHTLEHLHPIGRQGGILAKIFNVGWQGVFGGNQVINNIDFHFNGSGLYKATYGPSQRTLIDFADLDNALSVIPTGQSGRIMSKHYDDQAPLYNTGKYRKQMMNKDEIIKTAEGKLILKPVK